MMGAGGFIRNPEWEILSGDDLMDEDYENAVIVDNFFNDGDDLELNSEVVLFLPPEELDEEDDFDDIDNEEDEDDDDYVPSDSLDDEDFDDDNAIVMSSDDSAPELSK